MSAVKQLKSAGRVSRGQLGVGIDAIDRDEAQVLGLPDTRGALISSVQSGSPAEKAGIKRGDFIVGVDGKSAEDLADFYRKVRALGSAGVTVPLDIEREGTKQRIEIPSANRRDHLKLNSTL